MNTNNERKKRYRENNREKHLIYSRNYNNEYYKIRKIKDLCKKYNITTEDYNNIINKYDGKCYICKSDESRKGFNDLCIDHCHNTMKVRGLLCNSCNVGLGCFKDNPELLQIAINYLKL